MWAENPSDGFHDMSFWTGTDDDKVDIFAVTRGGGQMHFVQQGSSSHGDLRPKKLIVKERGHRPAQNQILLHLKEIGPWYRRLVGQDIATA